MKRDFIIKQIFVLIFSLISINLFPQTFTEQTGISLPGVSNSSVAWGDYNNDGYLDILLTGMSASGPVSKIFKNNGNNTFTEQIGILLTGIESGTGSWGDYDNDGDLDIILSGGSSIGSVSKIYRNNGNSTFTEQNGFSLAGGWSSTIAWGDYNNDGNLDILLTGQAGTSPNYYLITKVYRNNINKTYTEQRDISLEDVYLGATNWVDYDNDGDLDIFLSGLDINHRIISKIFQNNGNDAFSEQTDISFVGVSYSSVAWGDYDNDGDLDILLTGWKGADPHIVSIIYRNNGDNTFTEQTGISLTGVWRGSTVWGDYDNDGDLDILLTGATAPFPDTYPVSKIYCNNGDNTFTEQPSILLTGVFNSSVAWGDYDNDGDLDILLTGQDQNNNTISKIYRNNCTKINKVPDQTKNLSYKIQNRNALLKWTRITTDETSLKSLSYNVRISNVKETSYFVPPHSSLNGYRQIMTLGNSHLDTNFIFKNLLLDTNYIASVQAIDNSFKGGAFSEKVQFKISSIQSSQLTGTYVNNTSLLLKWKRGNGDRCIVLAKEGTTGKAILKNFTTYYSNPIFGEGSQIDTTNWYCIYKGAADSVLLNGLNSSKDYIIQVIEFEGINGSEIYVSSNTSDNIGVFNTSLFSNQIGVSLTSVDNSSVAWADYDNDGDLDVLLTGFSFSCIAKIYRNNGNNTFTEQTDIKLTPVLSSSVAWGDYDNDGYLDILLTGQDPMNNKVSKIYHNNGNNSFTEQAGISLTGVFISSVAWGDYDNDGYLDVLLTGAVGDFPNYNSISKIYHNNGNNTFTELSGSLLPGIYNSSVAWGDYDKDGYLDILLSGAVGNYPDYNLISKIYHNDGNNKFTEQTNISMIGAYCCSSSWGDYDNDGDLDILLTGSGYSKIYRNNDDNSFTEQTGISLKGVSFSSSSWGDYDNDGDLDVLVTGKSTDNKILSKIYCNNGNNTFTELTDIYLTGANYSSVAWGDYDNDGDIDILLTGSSETNGSSGRSPFSSVFRNNLIMRAGISKANAKPNAPTGLTCTITPNNVKFSWSPVANDETPAKTMSYNFRYKLKDETKWKFAPHTADNGFRRVEAIGNTQLNNEISFKKLPSGLYQWQVQAVDQGFQGGDWSTIDSVIVKTVQAFFATDIVCKGFPTNFTDQSVSGDGIKSWLWDFKDGQTSILQNPQHLYNSAGSYKVKLVVTSNSNEKDSLLQDVVVKAKPIPNFSCPPVCIGNPTLFTNLSNLNGLTINKWKWDYSDGQNATSELPGIHTHTYALPNNYSVKLRVDAPNGCSDSISKEATVSVFPDAALSSNGTLTFCSGDSVRLSVNNNPNYSYKWMLNNISITNATKNNFSAKSTGNYSVEATNTKGLCKTTSSPVAVTKLSMPATPVIVTQNYQEGKCPGENQIVLSVDQPVNEYTYQWKRNGSPISIANVGSHIDILSAGDYSVTANLSGCSTESGIKTIIYENAPPKPLIYIHGPKVWYLACSIANAAEYKYKWYYNGNIIPAADKYIYVANQNLGTYYVTIENIKGCYNSSDVIKIPTENLSIEESDPFTGLKIYPNPSSGQFVVEMDNLAYGEFIISVSAQGGRQVLSTKFRKTNEHFLNKVDLSGLPKGLYIINLKTEKYMATRKLVVE